MFFGRTEQLDALNALWGKRVSSLVTCRGRRRIGKSTLIRHFAELSGARFIKIEGLKPRKGYSNEDDALTRLEESGFVAKDAARNPVTGEELRECAYRLKDNYARFYLKFIEPSKDSIDGGAFAFGSLERLNGWDGIMGLQFENLIVNNFKSLLPKLNLSGALITSAAPYRKVGRKGEGCQIDLLLQAKRFVYLIEVKRQGKIERDIIDEVEQKRLRLGVPRDKSVRLALVYDGRLSPSVEAEGYFDSLVDAKSLLQ